MKKIFLFAIIALTTSGIFAQQLSNKLDYPCPASTRRAVIQFTSKGAINLIPCAGQKVTISELSGTSTLLTGISTASGSVVFSGTGTPASPLTGTIPNANGITTGLLTGADWTTFNVGASLANTALQSVATVNSASFSFSGNGTSANPLTGSVIFPIANATTTGLLTSANWATFNNGVTTANNALTVANNAVDKTCSGSGVLVAGAVAISNPCITASSKIFLSVNAPGGTQGFLSVSPIVAGTFTAHSTSNTDTSTIVWLAVN